MKHLAVLLLLSLAAGGCTTPDDILEKLDERTDEEIRDNVSHLTGMAGDSDEETILRCYAIKVLGMLKQPDDYSVRTLGLIVSRGGSGMLQEWAAWALGELEDSDAVPHLNDALQRPIGRSLGYRVVEALAKLFPHLVQDSSVTKETIRALTSYSANQKSALPEIYTVLEKAVSTLEFLVDVLHDFLNDPKNSLKDGRTWRSTYRAIYKLLELMEKRQAEIINIAPSQRKLLDRAFQDMSSSKVRSSRPMALLAAHGIGRTSDHLDLAARAAPGIIKFYNPGRSASVRLVSAWSMTRLQLYEASVSSTLRSRVLAAETNPQIFDLLADIHDRTDDYDEIQKLFTITGSD